MTRRAWVFVLDIIALGTVLGGIAFLNRVSTPANWQAFSLLALFATLSQLFKSIFKSSQISDTEGTISFSPFLIFLSAGIFLLPPWQFVLLVLIPHLVEWIKERLQKSSHLRFWYIQLFNISNHLCSGLLAWQTYQFLASVSSAATFLSQPLAALVALIIYATLNQLLTGIVIVLARGSTWKDTGMLQWNEWMPDFMLLCLGYPFAVLWVQNPLFSLFALSPMLLIQRALGVPQLQKEARVDAKTGLWNATHFSRLFLAEMERALRFDRPLSLIMADLDLLRNVNNTYGHLAGDTVLEIVSEVIRKTIREYDIAGRFGGEEFSICLPETDSVEAIIIAERIRENIAKTPIAIKTSSTPIYVTMSFGIASVPTDAKDPKGLIHQADLAVYQAKLRGRNCTVPVTDAPRSFRLDSIAIEDRLTDFAVSSAPPPTGPAKPKSEPSTSQQQQVEYSIREPRETPRRPEWITPFLGTVILAGLLATVLGLAQNQTFDAWLLAFLCVVGILSEWFEVGMYGDSTFSVSVTVVFATIFLSGFAGLVAISAAIALAHYFKNREIAWYKPVFNWATHVLAGLIPLWGFSLFQIPLVWQNLIPLAGLTLLTALGYYIVESGLISIAIGLSEKTNLRAIWFGQFGWTVLFYVALCLVGLFMAILYLDVKGVVGILVFALPMVLINLAQRQYLERTRAGAQELERMNKELTVANREIIQASMEIEQLNDELFTAMAKIIDARDPLVLDHANRVAEYATMIARKMLWPLERVETIHRAALLHDIGKLGISEQILKKPGRLTGLEYETVKAHTTLGWDLLESSRGLRHLAPFVRHHHEWWNGKGYPDHLSGGQIPLEARIIAVADAIEAMASDRPYHRGWRAEQIIAELSRCSGSQFDPTIVDMFVFLLKGGDIQLVASPTAPTRKTWNLPSANNGLLLNGPG